MVGSDGAVHPIAVSDSQGILIPSKGIESGFFRVLPDEQVHLVIAFNTLSSSVIGADDGLRLLPAFAVSRRTSCESARPFESTQAPSPTR
jgi:hypothetical protein